MIDNGVHVYPEKSGFFLLLTVFVFVFLNLDTVILGDLPDSNIFTPGHHVSELLLCPSPAVELVTDRLITLPPGAHWLSDHHMLIRRGNLEVTRDYFI